VRRKSTILGLALLISVIAVVMLAGPVLAAYNGYMQPAPYSGDGDPDGSGFDRIVGFGPGPAPNSGDGDPDGSGF